MKHTHNCMNITRIGENERTRDYNNTTTRFQIQENFRKMPRTKSKPTQNKQSEEEKEEDVIYLVSSSEEEEKQEVEKVEMVTTTKKRKKSSTEALPKNTILLKTLRFKGISKYVSLNGVERILTGPGAGYYRLLLLYGDEPVVLCPETLPELNELECFCLGRMTEEKLIYLRIKRDGELNIRVPVEGTTNSVYVDPYMTMSRGAFGYVVFEFSSSIECVTVSRLRHRLTRNSFIL